MRAWWVHRERHLAMLKIRADVAGYSSAEGVERPTIRDPSRPRRRPRDDQDRRAVGSLEHCRPADLARIDERVGRFWPDALAGTALLRPLR
jgi:hypothetical protein